MGSGSTFSSVGIGGGGNQDDNKRKMAAEASAKKQVKITTPDIEQEIRDESSDVCCHTHTSYILL